MKKTVKQMVKEANSRIETLSIEKALASLEQENTCFVDIRDVRELEREGCIPGAIHAPRGMLEFWVDPESPYHREEFASDKKFVFFCAAGWRSALATDTVQSMGMEKVCHIEGGFGAWKQAEGPIEARKTKNK